MLSVLMLLVRINKDLESVQRLILSVLSDVLPWLNNQQNKSEGGSTSCHDRRVSLGEIF